MQQQDLMPNFAGSCYLTVQLVLLNFHPCLLVSTIRENGCRLCVGQGRDTEHMRSPKGRTCSKH